jgi:hypothetical protein
MRSTRFALFAAIATLAIAPLADAKLSRTSDAAKAHFHSVTNISMAIDGDTPEVAVAEEGANIKVTVTLTNLTTGITLRDKHARELLEVGKFPTTTLTVPRALLKFPADGAKSEGDVPGSMNLHGQDKPVTFHYAASRRGAAISVTGSVALDITNFGMSEPSHLGIKVKKDVTVEVAFVAQDL